MDFICVTYEAVKSMFVQLFCIWPFIALSFHINQKVNMTDNKYAFNTVLFPTGGNEFIWSNNMLVMLFHINSPLLYSRRPLSQIFTCLQHFAIYPNAYCSGTVCLHILITWLWFSLQHCPLFKWEWFLLYKSNQIRYLTYLGHMI